MTKLDEMWVALAAYQPQADAKGHGKSWAKMCSEKTSAAAYAAAWTADADAAYAADAVAANAAGYADYAAAWAAYAAADAAAGAAGAAAWAADVVAAAAAAAGAEKYAQLAIDRINKARGNV